MRRIPSTFILCAAAMLFAATPSTTYAQSQLSQTIDVGGLISNNVASNLFAVNKTGVAVGQSLAQAPNGNTQWHAVVWSQTTGLVDLGALTANPNGYSEGHAVNASGWVAGRVQVQDPNNPYCNGCTVDHAYLWKPDANGQYTSAGIDLGTLGGRYSYAWDMNDSGQIVGEASVSGDNNTHAFVWTNGTMTDLGDLSGGSRYSTARFINNAGQIAGQAQTYTGNSHAFFYSSSTSMVDIGDLGNGWSDSRGLSETGVVTGESGTNQGSRGFFWKYGDSAPTTIGPFSGGQWFEVTANGMSGGAISSDGTRITGYGNVSNGQYRAFLYTIGDATPLKDLGSISTNNPYSQGYGVNNSGLVVGQSINQSGNDWVAAAFSVDGGAMSIADANTYRWGSAYAINDNGMAVGNAYHISSNNQHGLVWIFAPPPTVSITIASAFAGPLTGATIDFTVAASAGTPVCKLDGVAFASGGAASLGTHTLICKSTDPDTHAVGTATASFLVVYGAGGGGGTQGPAGPQGPTGPQGPAGADGAQGPKGDKGDTGAQGAKGDTGAQGAKGDTGAQGPAGADGAQGAKGDKGDAGAQGSKGDKGDTGAQGAKGDKGDTGAQGVKGDKGDTGAQGPAGADGAKGDKGDAGAPGAKGDTGAQGAKGDAGAQGVKGDTGAQGAKGDAGAQGAKGDKGDAGAQGPAGANGAKGDKGDAGAPGAKGDVGAQGAKGDAGAQGVKGDTGAQGAKGDAGAQGAKGDTGAQGAKGDTGATGAKGDKGDKGDTGAQGPAGPAGTTPSGALLFLQDGIAPPAGYVRVGSYKEERVDLDQPGGKKFNLTIVMWKKQ